MTITNVHRGTLSVYTLVVSTLFVGCVLPEYGRSESGEAGRTGIGGGSSSGLPSSSQASGSTRNSSSNNRGGAGGRTATETSNGGGGNRESSQANNGGTSAPEPNGGATAGGQTSQADTSNTGPQSGGTTTTSNSSNSVPTGGRSSNSTGGVVATGGTGGIQPLTGGTSSVTTVATGGRVASTTTTTAPVTGGTGGSTSVCSAGAKDCANGVPRTCVNGQWQTQAACASNQTCKAGQCVCTSGTKQCKSDGVTAQVCTDSGTWQDQACGGQNPYCYGAGACVPCKEGTKSCSGTTTPQLCSGGAWKAQTACSGTTPYCSGEGVCVACQEGSKRCNDNTPQLCSSGAWKDQTTCAGTTPVCTGNGVCGCPPSGGGPTMVGVSSGFCIDSTEVTRAQYAAWLRTNPTTSGQVVQCSWNTSFAVDATCMENPFTCKADCDGHPQICIDWCDAYAYCKAVGKRLCGKIGGGPNSYNDNLNVTRSQLYAACTSNGTNNYTYGDTFTDGVCNVYETFVYATVTAGSMSGCQSPTSGFKGIYDLTGNVAEWEDSCENSAAGGYCRVRGGDYVAMGEYESCSVDGSSQRNTASPSNGFRCCSP